MARWLSLNNRIQVSQWTIPPNSCQVPNVPKFECVHPHTCTQGEYICTHTRTHACTHTHTHRVNTYAHTHAHRVNINPPTHYTVSMQWTRRKCPHAHRGGFTETHVCTSTKKHRPEEDWGWTAAQWCLLLMLISCMMKMCTWWWVEGILTSLTVHQ